MASRPRSPKKLRDEPWHIDDNLFPSQELPSLKNQSPAKAPENRGIPKKKMSKPQQKTHFPRGKLAVKRRFRDSTWVCDSLVGTKSPGTDSDRDCWGGDKWDKTCPTSMSKWLANLMYLNLVDKHHVKYEHPESWMSEVPSLGQIIPRTLSYSSCQTIDVAFLRLEPNMASQSWPDLETVAVKKWLWPTQKHLGWVDEKNPETVWKSSYVHHTVDGSDILHQLIGISQYLQGVLTSKAVQGFLNYQQYFSIASYHVFIILFMEEIPHHLTCMKPCK